MAIKNKDLANAYWRANIKLIFSLLIVWFTVSFVFGILLVGVSFSCEQVLICVVRQLVKL